MGKVRPLVNESWFFLCANFVEEPLSTGNMLEGYRSGRTCTNFYSVGTSRTRAATARLYSLVRIENEWENRLLTWSKIVLRKKRNHTFVDPFRDRRHYPMVGVESENPANPAKPSVELEEKLQLDARTKWPILYHCCEGRLWEEASNDSAGGSAAAAGSRAGSAAGQYFPPTFASDGITHCTADVRRILPVLNHFYKSSPLSEAWVCLKMSCDSLAENGAVVKFEAPADVGATKTKSFEGVELFPHIYGGIPVRSVLEVTAVRRDGYSGEFVGIEGVV